MGTLLKNVHNYQRLISEIILLIEFSGYDDFNLANQMGMKLKTFLNKKQKANWPVEQVLKLVSIIENNLPEDYFDYIKIRESEKGIFISSAAFEKNMVGIN